MTQFARTTELLSEIEGLQGAVIFNISSLEVLVNVQQKFDLSASVTAASESIIRHQQLIQEMGLFDFAESSIVTSDDYYHIVYMLPQFDSVAIYLVLTRYIMLPYVLDKLEKVIFSMR